MSRARAHGPDITPGRLEAFSDGVIAIVITVMVLELHAPTDPRPAALLALWPDFAGYVVSFAFIATFWVNHRHILRRLAEVREPVLWTNVVFLFALSLIPFFTAYLGRTRLAAFPMALYAGVLMACGASFAVLRALIARQIADPQEARAFNGPRDKAVGAITVAMMAAALALSFVSPAIAFAVIALSSLLHIAPLTRRA